MLAAAATGEKRMVAPAASAGNQLCLNQYQWEAVSFSQWSRP